MDKKFQDIVDSLPEKPARSRLELYSQLIDELRRQAHRIRVLKGLSAMLLNPKYFMIQYY